MTLEINVVRNLNNNKVLIEEKDKSYPKIKSCMYVVNKDKSDAFILTRKNDTLVDYWNIISNLSIGISGGLLIFNSFKTKNIAKSFYNTLAVGATFVFANIIGKAIKNFRRNVTVKQFKAEKINPNKELKNTRSDQN